MRVNISTPRHHFNDSGDPDGYYYTYISDRPAYFHWHDDDEPGWRRSFEHYDGGLKVHRKDGACTSHFLSDSPEIEMRAPIHRLAMVLHVMVVAYSHDCIATLAEGLRFLSDGSVNRSMLLEYD